MNIDAARVLVTFVGNLLITVAIVSAICGVILTLALSPGMPLLICGIICAFSATIANTITSEKDIFVDYLTGNKNKKGY